MMIYAKLFDKDSGQYKLLLKPHSAVLVTQLVKNPPAMQETWVQSLGWEDPLEKGMATHSSIPTWRILNITLLVCEMSAIMR